MVKSLTKEQLEFAAQSSYAYWLASVSNKPPPTPHERLHMARKEARRFLFGNDYGKAYREYHESCDFRKVSLPVVYSTTRCVCLETFERIHPSFQFANF